MQTVELPRFDLENALRLVTFDTMDEVIAGMRSSVSNQPSWKSLKYMCFNAPYPWLSSEELAQVDVKTRIYATEDFYGS